MILSWSKIEPGILVTWSGKNKTHIANPVTTNTSYTAGVVGPMGPPGSPGSSSLEPLVFKVLIPGSQILQLSKATSFGFLFMNGLMQDPASYTIVGNQVLIPSDMGLIPNDMIYFIY